MSHDEQSIPESSQYIGYTRWQYYHCVHFPLELRVHTVVIDMAARWQHTMGTLSRVLSF